MKEIMKILSENKRKEQLRQKQLRKAKEHAKDILTTTWICVGIIVYFIILSVM